MRNGGQRRLFKEKRGLCPAFFSPSARQLEAAYQLQVRYCTRNKVMPGKNSSSKVRKVSLIRNGVMPR